MAYKSIKRADGAVKGFPVSVFFSIEEPDTVNPEAAHLHRMNIGRRMEDYLG